MIENLMKLLHIGKYSCVILNKTEVRIFHRSEIIDLHDLLQHETGYLKGATIADKLVDKAVASLMIYGGVERVYADIISEDALEMLYQAKIRTEYLQKVTLADNKDRTLYPLKLNYREKRSIRAMLLSVLNFMKGKSYL